MTDFADDIRKIAKGTRRKSALSPYAGRDPVLGGSVTLVTDTYSGVGDTPTGSAPNSPTSQENNDGENPAPDSSNPDSFYSGGAGSGVGFAEQQGEYDAEDIIDGTDGPTTSPEANGDYSSAYDGSLKSLTGVTDCETGKCINFHTDGNFPVPEGWEDADTPPTHEYYEEGFYWQTQSLLGSVGIGASPYQAFYDRPPSEVLGSLSTRFEQYLGQDTVVYQSSVSCGIKYGGGCFTSVRIYKIICPGPSSETATACSSEPPTEESWPEDGCYDLALKDGSFQVNQYDSEAPAGAGGSKVNFCFGDGRTGSVEVTANGGFMVYETDGGAPTGTTRVYDSNGRMTAAGDSTTQFQDQWRPK